VGTVMPAIRGDVSLNVLPANVVWALATPTADHRPTRVPIAALSARAGVEPTLRALDNVSSVIPCDASELTAALTSGRAALDAAAYDEAWLTGRSMTLDAAIAVGLAVTVAAPSGTRTSAPLTARELEIAALVADGLTNALIAARLGITQRTVDTHVSNVLRKFGVSTRAAVAAALRVHPHT